MSESEMLEAAKRFAERYGTDALTEANKSLQDVIRQRDAEAITYWRDLIAAIPRVQP